MELFNLIDVSKEHNLGSVKLKSLNKLNLTVEAGRITSITGPEAAGKSRLVHLLSFNDTATHGTIEYKGRQVARLDEKMISKIRTCEIGLIPQSFHLNSTISILDNVSMVAKIMGQDNWVAQEKAEHWLESMGLQDCMNEFPIELRLLEFKKVGIAKAMMREPDVLICDDLYQHMSDQECEEAGSLLVNLNRDHGITVVQTARTEDLTKGSDVYYELHNGYCTSKRSSSFHAA